VLTATGCSLRRMVARVAYFGRLDPLQLGFELSRNRSDGRAGERFETCPARGMVEAAETRRSRRARASSGAARKPSAAAPPAPVIGGVRRSTRWSHLTQLTRSSTSRAGPPRRPRPARQARKRSSTLGTALGSCTSTSMGPEIPAATDPSWRAPRLQPLGAHRALKAQGTRENCRDATVSPITQSYFFASRQNRHSGRESQSQ